MKALCKVCVPALECSRNVPRPRRMLLVQIVALILVVQAPKARAQGLATPAAAAPSSAPSPADRVYRNGVIFTANPRNGTAEALAIRNGRILYVGGNQGVTPFVGPATVSVDLKGRFLMPGLVDGHMHPLEAGVQLLKCSLNYESLTIAEMQQRIQTCLDTSASEDANAWLEVVSWFQESMRPVGVKTNRATLDALKTTRPILVTSSFGHTALANTRALALAKITASTPDPIGGKIWRDDHGEPTGLLEDAAYAVLSDLLPKPTDSEYVALRTRDRAQRGWRSARRGGTGPRVCEAI
jgi:predicted amidohydrolase YtcJ